jgi:hypothetical protein
MAASTLRSYSAHDFVMGVILVITILNKSLHKAIYQRVLFSEHQIALHISTYQSDKEQSVHPN